MKEIQRLQLELLKKLDEVCHRHNLRYYLAYGTCIGAMRHQGFIPWDHDVDVLMPFRDAWELPKYQEEFGDGCRVTTFRNDPEYKSVSIRLTDRNHRCRSIENGKEGIEFVAMDIYPFYNCPESKLGLLANVLRSHVYKMLVGGPPRNHGRLMAAASRAILLFHRKANRMRDIERIERKLNYQGRSSRIADYYGRDITLLSAITYRAEWFGKPSRLLFENLEFDGPTDPDRYLTVRYGDYMTPPTKEQLEKEPRAVLIE